MLGLWYYGAGLFVCPLLLTVLPDAPSVVRRIMRQAVAELAQAVDAVAARLAFPGDAFVVALSGGLLAHQSTFRLRVAGAVRRHPLSSFLMVGCPVEAAARAALEEARSHGNA